MSRAIFQLIIIILFFCCAWHAASNKFAHEIDFVGCVRRIAYIRIKARSLV